MSTRALKKLEKANIEDELAQITGLDSKDHYKKSKSQKQNAFALLGGLDDEVNDEDSDNGNDDKNEQQTVVEPVKEQAEQSKPVMHAKSKSKSKKSNQKAGQQRTIDDLDDDELDKLLASVKISSPKPVDKPRDVYEDGGPLLTVSRYMSCISLLQFNPKYLDPDKEYESLFGKLSNAAIEDADSTTSSFIEPEVLAQIKKLSKRVRGWGGKDHRSIPGTSRKLVMTKIRDDWLPSLKRPMIMQELPTEDPEEKKYSIKYFKLLAGLIYGEELDTDFYMYSVIEPNHERLIELLQKAPYHLQTILQVATILQRQGDNSNTNGLVERALFVFDWSLKPSFDLGRAKSRLPFKYHLNRQVYLTLFRYIIVLTKKSTFSTALNYCKLLLSFSPADDPYGVRYMIDFYAYMADEFQFLVDLYHSPLIQCYEQWLTPSVCFTAAFCEYQLGHEDESQKLLADAVKRHPFTAVEILNKLGGFASPVDASDAERIASAIHLVRLDTILQGPIKEFAKTKLQELVKHATPPGHFGQLQDIPKNLLRNVVLSGESSAMGRIPESFWNDVYEFDVLPPSNAE